jgi:hypothetical protein
MVLEAPLRAGSLVAFTLVLVASTGPTPASSSSAPSGAALVPDVAARMSATAVSFEPNLGQFHGRVRFVSRGPSYTLFLTDSTAVLALRPRSADGSPGPVIRLSLDNAAARRVVGLEQQPGTVNYLIGDDPAKWRTGVPTYSKVRYESVYPGIDLVYYGQQGLHEYDFVVAPGADPARIALRVSGADRMRIDGAGNLLLDTAGGTVTMRAPSVFQLVDGTRQTVAAGFEVDAGGAVQFALGPYDHSETLVIDPQIVYGTFLGGSGSGVDQIRGVALDADGAVYVAGMTETTDYPTESGVQMRTGGPSDAVVVKLSPDGRRIFATYLGGSGYEGADDIDVRGDGAIYVAGGTSSADFPVRDAFQSRLRGSSDAFVTEMAIDGRSLVRSTYLGGGDGDGATGIELARHADAGPPAVEGEPAPVANAFGDLVFVFGSTTSPDFPTEKASQTTRAGERDAFITAFRRDTLRPAYSTYAGRAGSSTAESLVLNRADGEFYVMLQRTDEAGPYLGRFRARRPAASARVTIGGPWYGEAGYLGFDAALEAYRFGFEPPEQEAIPLQAKAATLLDCKSEPAQWLFDSDAKQLTQMVMESCLKPAKNLSKRSAGRSGAAAVSPEDLDRTVVMAVMPGCLPVAPATTCSERAVLVLYDEELRVIGRLNFGGTRVGREFIPTRFAADRDGRFHIIGRTSDATLPLVNPVQGAHRGSSEGFIITLDPLSGETSFFSYLGGASFDTLADIAVDAQGNRWIVGDSQSSDFPTTRSGVQPELRGRMDGFVVKIQP